MVLKLMCGVLELYFTSYFVVFHLSGQVCLQFCTFVFNIFTLFEVQLRLETNNSFANVLTYNLRYFLTLNLLSCSAETEQGVAQAIIRSAVDFKRDPWPKVSDNAKDLVKKMLDPDPKRRLTAQQVLGNYKF